MSDRSDVEEVTAGLPTRSDYGAGIYRRCVTLEAEGAEAWGELADDFHHFAVRLRQDGKAVVEIDGEDIRTPWVTCPGAKDPLRRMIGAELQRDLSAVQRHTDALAQCTHWHDLACLVVGHAARVCDGGEARRRYDVAVPDRIGQKCKATLQRDGAVISTWSLEGLGLARATPAIFEGMPLRGAGFREFLRDHLDPELAEAAFVFQRAAFIALGRHHDFDRMAGAWQFSHIVGASCHSFSPERVDEAHRVVGSIRDRTTAPERVLDRDDPA